MKDINQMGLEFKELEKGILRLKQLEKQELNSLNTEGFEADANAIKSKLKDPRKIIRRTEELLNKAKSEFVTGNYEEAISDASRSEEVAKEIKEEAKPEIDVALSKKGFLMGVWEKVLLKVLNKWNANAKNIEIEFERAEVEGLELLKSLGVGKEKDLTVDFESKDAGSVPLKIDIRFEDLDGKNYEETETVHINVGEVKRKIVKEEEYDKGAYWFAISIQNNTDKTIEEWDIDLEMSAALKVSAVKIEGIEREIRQEAHLKSFEISVPKAYGITIPEGGSQRVYFKLRAEKDTKTEKYLDKLLVLKNYTEGFSDTFTKQVVVLRGS